MRARLALALLAVALPLAACSDDPAPAALDPVSTASAAAASPTSSAVPASAAPSASRSPRPAGVPEASTTDEGVVYGKITSATAEGFTYDKVTYDEKRCFAVEGDDNLRYDVKTAACFSNVNARLRTVRFAPGARVEVQNEGGLPDPYRPSQLVDLLGAQANVDTPPEYRVWEITVRSGLVTEVAAFQVAGA
ncbi:MAG: hypothetical protein JWM64_2087 [Frankiales bacterium]|nr:hypothetical protein [Frankiales bacterium]